MVCVNRKFADIEAANHRLASALYFKEGEEKNKPDTPDQSSQSGHLKDQDKCSVHSDTNGILKSRSDVTVDLYEVSEKKQPGSGHLWKRHPKSQSLRKNNHSKRKQRKESKVVELTSISTTKDTDFPHGAELCHTEYYSDEHQLNPSFSEGWNNFSEDTQTPLNDSSFIQFNSNVDISPSFSPELSPLSLDSCDFSIQMFTELSGCTPAQRGIADVNEGQLTDILDLISVGNKDSEGCMDVEAYFESICECQGDAGQEAGLHDVTFAEQSDGFAEVEGLHCDGGEYTYECGYSCHGDQDRTSDYILNWSAERQNVYTAQGQSHSKDIIQHQAPASINCHFNTAQQQTYRQSQKESDCMQVNCKYNPQFTPFEGVAQSFSAPLHNPEIRPVPTPPQDEDWLFTDILKDRTSPDYQENKAVIDFNC